MLLIGFRSASGGLTVVSAANPLPVTGGGGGGGGDASAANQVLAQASLTSIDTKLANNATSTLQSALNTLVGAQNATAWASGDGTLISLLKTMAGAAVSTDPLESVGYLETVAVTPTVEAAPDYAAADVIGGVMTFAAILRGNAKTAYAVSVRLTSKVAAASMAALDVYFFNANPSVSTVTENGAFTLADADRAKYLGKIKVTEWGVIGAAVSEAYAEGRVPITGAAADDIYVVMVARGAINLGSTSDLTVAVTVDQN